ncbi:MAG: hypothetical protein CML68_19885 [Rhodobacteraceae bacterium]|nr:hypothetical protein [Paracoccaceae bacterium]
MSLTATLALLLTGCIEAPELDAVADPELARAAYPELIPLGPVIAAGTAATGATPESQGADLQAGLEGRVARLQSQAEALRRSDVLDTEARQRLMRQLGR